jgi:hypothetical protein
MKLKQFDSTNVKAAPRGVATVNINTKNGCLSFSRTFIEAVGWAEGTPVAFSQDEARPADWYVAVADEGFPLRGKQGALLAQSAAMARQILGSLSVQSKTVSCRMSTEPIELDGVKYHAILTKTANLA